MVCYGLTGQQSRVPDVTLFALDLEPLILRPIRWGSCGIAAVYAHPVVRENTEVVRSCRRFLRRVPNPDVCVVAFVTFRAVRDGKRAVGAVVVGNPVGIYQATGGDFGNSGNAPAVFNGKIKGRGVRQGDTVCIRKAAGGMLHDAADTAMAVSGGGQPVQQNLSRQLLCRAVLFQDEKVSGFYLFCCNQLGYCFICDKSYLLQ